MARLLEHGAAILGVGIVAEIHALIDEALAMRVQHHAEEIAYLAIVLALHRRQVEVAVLLHVQVHRRGVAAGIAAVARRAQRPGDTQPVAGVVRCAAHPRRRPVRSDVV